MNEGGINKKNIVSQESSPQDKKSFFRKVMTNYSNCTLNGEQLDEYRNSKLPTIKVIKRLRDLGLLEDIKNFQEELPAQPINSEEEGEEFEKLARAILKEIETNQK
jgi:hypothetical protein